MIGNRVRVIRTNGPAVEGVLHHLDAAGAIVDRAFAQLPEARGKLFLPLPHIVEIVDLGRAP